jgi:low affinity Fe/Cu permease
MPRQRRSFTPSRAPSSRAAANGSWFDRFAQASSDFASRGAFFAGCALLVVVWAPSYFVIRNLDTWQLIINTATTIVTFLLVALLQNAARRSDRAIHHKLDAIADGLADLMEHEVEGNAADLNEDIKDLKHAVGLEKRLCGRDGSRLRSAPST